MATETSVNKRARVGRPSIDPPENREEQLLDIARKLFAQNGFSSTSLRDIADAARITKAALYYYFPDKDQLYERVVIESLQNLVKIVSAAVDSAHTPRDRVRAFMLASADFLDNERDHWLAAAHAFRDASQTGRRDVAVQLRDDYEKLLRVCIAEGVASGDFCDVDPAMTGRFLLSGLNHVTRWHSPSGKFTVRQVTEQFLTFGLRGLETREEVGTRPATLSSASVALKKSAAKSSGAPAKGAAKKPVTALLKAPGKPSAKPSAKPPASAAVTTSAKTSAEKIAKTGANPAVAPLVKRAAKNSR